ncbi:hypothetical protein [Neobacillus piezotolerans]|nr:hypothetical protein [Neobacillus piezotolerans]
MQQSSITIDTNKTIITLSNSGETIDNTHFEPGKEYVVTIQLTKIK